MDILHSARAANECVAQKKNVEKLFFDSENEIPTQTNVNPSPVHYFDKILLRSLKSILH